MIIVTDKEMEALLFVMDDPPLLSKLVAPYGLRLDQALRVVARLRPLLEGRMMPRELGLHGRIVIQACIEDSDWPGAYLEHWPEGLDEAHKVLRDLARKVEPLGIHVNRIAHA